MKDGKKLKKSVAVVLAGAVMFTTVLAPAPVTASAKTNKAPARYSGGKYVLATNYNTGIDLYGADGKVKKSYKLITDPDKTYAMGEIYRTENYIYYCDTNEGYSESGSVWQVPYNKKKDRINVKKKKRLFKVKEWEGFAYATDKKVVYLRRNSIVSYNKKKKKKTTLVQEGNQKTILLARDSNGCNAKSGNYVFYTVEDYYSSQKEEHRLYQLNLSTGKKKKLSVSVALPWQLRRGHDYAQIAPILGISGNYIYIPTGASIARYNVKKQKMTEFAQADPASSAITTIAACLSANEDLDRILRWDVMNLYEYGKKLYLQICIKYNYNANGEDASSYDEKYVILSMNRSNGKKITYEKELSKFLADNGVGYKDEDYDGLEYWTRHTGNMIALTKKGTWIGEFVGKDNKFCYYTYSMKTKKTKVYSAAKAKLRLLKSGVNDDNAPLIC